jgi:transcriptional regulator with XRE-family HTH domain
MMSVYYRIKELREAKDLSQSELAELMGISQSALGNYERGDRVPDADLIKKFAQLFKVSSDYLLGLSDCTAAENDDIAKQTGLNEDAIEYLKWNRACDGAVNDLHIDIGEFISSFVVNLDRSDFLLWLTNFLDDSDMDKRVERSRSYDSAIQANLNLNDKDYRKIITATIEKNLADAFIDVAQKIKEEKNEGADNGDGTETR